MNKLALSVAGCVFALVAFIHLFRLVYHFPLVIGTSVPLWVNGLGFIIAGCLSFWMFYTSRHSK